jgi:PmbA protein
MSDARFSYSQDDFKRIAQFVLDHAKANGASAADTEVSEGFGQTVTVRKNEIETVEYNKDKGVGVTVYMGHRKGHASTSDLSDAALKATVEKAATIAHPYSFLASAHHIPAIHRKNKLSVYITPK